MDTQAKAPTKSANDMTYDELKAYVGRLERRATLDNGIKISEKGAISIYGLGQWPVTLYFEQWERFIVDKLPKLQAFMLANVNNPLITRKPPKADKAAAKA